MKLYCHGPVLIKKFALNREVKSIVQGLKKYMLQLFGVSNGLAGFLSGFWSRGVKMRYNGFQGGGKYYPLGSKAYGYLGHL